MKIVPHTTRQLSRDLPCLDCGQRKREDELAIDEHQTTLLERAEQFLDGLCRQEQSQFPPDSGRGSGPVTAR
jgi:hypothetical protein